MSEREPRPFSGEYEETKVPDSEETILPEEHEISDEVKSIMESLHSSSALWKEYEAQEQPAYVEGRTPINALLNAESGQVLHLGHYMDTKIKERLNRDPGQKASVTFWHYMPMGSDPSRLELMRADDTLSQKAKINLERALKLLNEGRFKK